MNIDATSNPSAAAAQHPLDSTGTGKPSLKSATQDFEGMFVSYLLKVMRSTVDSEENGEMSMGKDQYTDLFDNEIALSIARNRGMGIGDLIYRQLQDSGRADTSASPQTDAINPVPPTLSSAAIAPALSAPLNGIVTSAYGLRSDPIHGGSEFHKGIDIAAPQGTPFKAASAGTVIFAGVLGGYGKTLIIEHAGGERTLYAHASELLVGQGDRVSTEQPIGLVGTTGRTTGPHLHFEAVLGGQQIDPKGLLLTKISSNVGSPTTR